MDFRIVTDAATYDALENEDNQWIVNIAFKSGVKARYTFEHHTRTGVAQYIFIIDEATSLKFPKT